MVREDADPAILAGLYICGLNVNVLFIFDDEVALDEGVILVVESGALFLDQRFDRDGQSAPYLVEVGDYCGSECKQGHADNGTGKPVVELSGCAVVLSYDPNEREENNDAGKDHCQVAEFLQEGCFDLAANIGDEFSHHIHQFLDLSAWQPGFPWNGTGAWCRALQRVAHEASLIQRRGVDDGVGAIRAFENGVALRGLAHDGPA